MKMKRREIMRALTDAHSKATSFPVDDRSMACYDLGFAAACGWMLKMISDDAAFFYPYGCYGDDAFLEMRDAFETNLYGD